MTSRGLQDEIQKTTTAGTPKTMTMCLTVVGKRVRSADTTDVDRNGRYSEIHLDRHDDDDGEDGVDK